MWCRALSLKISFYILILTHINPWITETKDKGKLLGNYRHKRRRERHMKGHINLYYHIERYRKHFGEMSDGH